MKEVEHLFTRKFTAIVGLVVGAIPVLVAGVLALQKQLPMSQVLLICLGIGAVIAIGAWLLSRRVK